MSEEKREDMNFFENCEVIGNVNTYELDKYLRVDKKSFDEILEDMVKALGGQIVTSITRKLPGKRMPARNNFSKTIW